MKTFQGNKTKPMAAVLSILTLIAIITVAPHAFAQLSYSPADDPHGQMQPFGWIVGLGAAGIMSGFGVLTAVRRRKH